MKPRKLSVKFIFHFVQAAISGGVVKNNEKATVSPKRSEFMSNHLIGEHTGDYQQESIEEVLVPLSYLVP